MDHLLKIMTLLKRAKALRFVIIPILSGFNTNSLPKIEKTCSKEGICHSL